MANDHYVPRFYLKNFGISDSQSLIYSYKKGFAPTKKAISQIACAEDYYSVNQGNHSISTKENNEYLQKIEYFNAPIVKKIISEQDLSLDNNDKLYLSYFVSTLATRTPLVHEYFKKQIIHDNKAILKYAASNKDEFHSFMKMKDKSLSNTSIEKIRQIYLESDKHLIFNLLENDNNKAYLRSLLPGVHSELLRRRILISHWHILISENKKFVTSDNPVVFLFPRPFQNQAKATLISPIFLPLSPNIALMIHPWNFVSNKIILSDSQIKFYVQQSILFAKDLVFSNAKSEEIKILLEKRSQDLRDLNYHYNFLSSGKLKFLLKKKLILKDLFNNSEKCGNTA